MAGQPLQAPLGECLDRQGAREYGLQGCGEVRQALLHGGGTVGGDPPDGRAAVEAGGCPVRGQGALSDPAEPGNRLDQGRAGGGERGVEEVEFAVAPDEQARLVRQVVQARRGIHLGGRPQRLGWQLYGGFVDAGDGDGARPDGLGVPRPVGHGVGVPDVGERVLPGGRL